MRLAVCVVYYTAYYNVGSVYGLDTLHNHMSSATEPAVLISGHE